jgi:hypothetical protein
MNAELRAITRSQLREMLGDWEHAESVYSMSAGADPLFVAELGETILGYMAFIPRSTLSDTAYVWVQVMPGGEQHRLAIGRLARRWAPIVYSRYKTLVAHCGNNRHDLNWVSYIGGRLTGSQGHLLRFVIEAGNE